MRYLFILAVFILAALIIRYSGMKRFIIYLAAITFIPYAVLISRQPIFPSNRLLALAFFISVAIRPRRALQAISKCPWYLLAGLLLVYIGQMMTAIMDQRLPLGTALMKANMRFFDSYLLLAIGFFSLYGNITLRQLNKALIAIGIIVGAYAIVTAAWGYDPYTTTIVNSFNSVSDFTAFGVGSRYHICSFLFNSHALGFFCAAAFITITLFNKKGLLHNIPALASLALLFAGTLLSGSRSSLIALLMCLVFMAFMLFKGTTRLGVFFGIFTLCVAILVIPASRKRIQPLVDAFRTGEVETGGSNIRMRLNQLDLAYIFYRQNPVWGNGYDYYTEVLVPDRKVISNQGLAGAESYIFMMLIEYGLVQIILISLFILLLAFFFITKLRRHPIYATWGACILGLMFFVAIASGMSMNWKFSLPFIGMAVRALVNADKRKKAITLS